MRVLVTGGRDYAHGLYVYKALKLIHQAIPGGITRIVNGGANGADYLSSLWALTNKVEHKTYPANWTNHGNRAGPIRNSRMLREEKPDLVVVFPGGSGTLDMYKKAKESGTKILDLRKEPTLMQQPEATTEEKVKLLKWAKSLKQLDALIYTGGDVDQRFSKNQKVLFDSVNTQFNPMETYHGVVINVLIESELNPGSFRTVEAYGRWFEQEEPPIVEMVQEQEKIEVKEEIVVDNPLWGAFS